MYEIKSDMFNALAEDILRLGGSFIYWIFRL